MPELPDIAVFKQYVDATSLHQPIAAVQVKDAIVLANTSIQAFRRQLTGQSFASSHRHGKYLFVKLSEDLSLIMHFGMTGSLDYYKEEAGTPDYTQARFDFENGYHLAFVMPRKLGEIRLVEDENAFVRAKALGPDVLSPEFDREAFGQALSGRRGMIKTALMDQSLMAGIGNVYSDEILYQARLHPKTKVNALDEEGRAELYRIMQEVLQTAIECQAQPDDFPGNYLTPHRSPGAPCPRCQGEIERIKVAGRSAYYCPQCQPRPKDAS